jgi:14-3-3 protein epsilon
MSGTQAECVFMARLAEQAERYEDMVEYMKRVATMGFELSLDERNLLSVAYKNTVGARRQAWRAIHSLEQREAGKPAVTAIIKDYRAKVETELNSKCAEILATLASELIPKASDSEAKVFYLKMKGDYHRYLAEFANRDSGDYAKHAQDAHDSYELAMAAAADLPPVHPVRLGLALNFSVFYFEVFGAPDKAIKLAGEAFNEAMSKLDSVDQDTYRDAEQIIQLLRDNLTLWQSDSSGGAGGQDGTAVEDL